MAFISHLLVLIIAATIMFEVFLKATILVIIIGKILSAELLTETEESLLVAELPFDIDWSSAMNPPVSNLPDEASLPPEKG